MSQFGIDGGGARRRIRTVDFERKEAGKHLVERIEYDPNRSAHLALLEHVETKKKSYIIAAEGMRAGDAVESYRSGIPRALIQSMGGTVDPGMLAAKTAFRGQLSADAYGTPRYAGPLRGLSSTTRSGLLPQCRELMQR